MKNKITLVVPIKNWHSILRLKIILLLAFFICNHSRIKAQKVEFDHWNQFGLNLSISSTGFGGGILWSPNPYGKFYFKLAYEYLDLSNFIESEYDFTFNSVEIEGQTIPLFSKNKFKTGGVSLLGYYHLLDLLYLNAGLMYTNFKFSVSGNPTASVRYNDIYLPPKMIGTIDMTLSPKSKITPYIGIGFGRSLSSYKQISAALEIGTYYLWSTKLDIEATGLLSAAAEQEHIERLNRVVKNTKLLYPVVRASIGYKF